MVYELFKELIKEEIQAGLSQQVHKIELVENALHQLAIVDDTDFNNLISKYRDRKQEIIKKQIELSEELNKLVETYYDALIKGL